MTGKLTVSRKFNIAREGLGRKRFREGEETAKPAGRVQRISRVMALGCAAGDVEKSLRTKMKVHCSRTLNVLLVIHEHVGAIIFRLAAFSTFQFNESKTRLR